MSEIKGQAVQFDPHKQPWPEGVIPWKEAGYQPRDMSWGYIDTAKGRVHVQSGDWIVTNSQGEKRVERNQDRANEITRTVAIEHAGEKINIEVHVHLTPEEIKRLVVPAVLNEIAEHMQMQVRFVTGGVM